MPETIPRPWRGESAPQPGRLEADALGAYVDASPSPYHAVAEAARQLDAAGFAELAETSRWPNRRGRFYLRRAGSLIAWSTERSGRPGTPFRVVGAHSDSPNLRIKPRPEHSRAGWQLLGVEGYGGGLWHTWLDRDLGLSGRVAVLGENGVETRLFRVDRPILRVPNLAIHLDREVRDKGVQINPQTHLTPVWGIGTGSRDFAAFVAKEAGVEPTDLLSWEAMAHDVSACCRIGVDGDMLSAPRLDNQASCYAGTRALIAAAGSADDAVDEQDAVVPVLAIFDHEEVGSVSERGAGSTLLSTVFERVVGSAGGDREDLYRALAGTVVASADMAHATHPHHVERHDPIHQIEINGGPVLKLNANLRYATDARGAAEFRLATEQAGVPLQSFVNRSDLPCGSTIGPMTAAGAGVTTVDVGAPQLAMHSVRELCGADDPAMYSAALGAFLAPRRP